MRSTGGGRGGERTSTRRFFFFCFKSPPPPSRLHSTVFSEGPALRSCRFLFIFPTQLLHYGFSFPPPRHGIIIHFRLRLFFFFHHLHGGGSASARSCL